nr:MAG TPA: hypothetical protein [Bacteriophage sp.]
MLHVLHELQTLQSIILHSVSNFNGLSVSIYLPQPQIIDCSIYLSCTKSVCVIRNSNSFIHIAATTDLLSMIALYLNLLSTLFVIFRMIY